MTVCPVIFDPIYKPKIWGGRRMSDLLNRDLPGHEPIGESWEVADLEEDQSIARAAPPAAGKSLGDLVREWGGDLMGRAALVDGRFPLLVKYLDARDVLSVQVHPDAATAAARGGNVRIKNEAWYVLAADDEACIHRGLAPGVDRQAFTDAVDAGTVSSALRRIPVRAGDCYYLPSGTVHALGAGVVVAEVQTPSDITYRVYDWNRTDPSTGRGRDLHIGEALDCIVFEPREFEEEQRITLDGAWPHATRLITCESFLIDEIRADAGFACSPSAAELAVWMILEGAGRIEPEHGPGVEFRCGNTVVIPAALGPFRVSTLEDSRWLQATLPIIT